MNNTLALMASYAQVVKTGSFTRAGARLGLSKSVVSRHVSALEKELGAQLLYRSTHRLSPTEAGERVFECCRDLDQVAEQAANVVNAAQGAPRGLVRLTLPQTLVVSPVGRMISRFQVRHAEVQLDVRVTSLQVDPIEEGFDLALRMGALVDSNLLCRRLARVRTVAVATPAYVKKHGRPRTLKELAAHAAIEYSEFGSRRRVSGTRRAAARAPLLATNSGVLLMHALLAGQGIATGPELMFEPHLTQRVLTVVLDSFAPADLYAVFPPGRFPTAARKALVDHLVTELAVLGYQ